MEIEKTNRMNALFEFYSTLLTEKQMNYIELYYGDDLSLGEIAEEYGVSRQAVYDNIKRTEKTLEKIKEMFYTTKQNGTGLGVALSNEIIKSHNGELIFESETNKGTTATIRLPFV